MKPAMQHFVEDKMPSSRVPFEESSCLWEGRMASLRVENVAFPTRRTLLRIAFQFLFQTSLITSPSSHPWLPRAPCMCQHGDVSIY